MIETATPALLTAALELHARGLSVIPIHPGRKRPLVSWAAAQHRRATVETLGTWWTWWPSANLGIVTGAVSGVVVFDVDSAEGWDTFCALGISALVDGRGPWVAKTARGFHIYFAHPGGVVRSRTGLLPGVDLRGDGGFTVAPPSVHANGTRYEWLTPPGFLPLAPLPRVLRVLLASAANGNGHASAPGLAMENAKPIPEGQRNATLFARARSRLARGARPATLKAALLAENAARCLPPLSEVEVRAICDHAATEAHEPGFEPLERMSEAEAQGYAMGRRARRQGEGTMSEDMTNANERNGSFWYRELVLGYVVEHTPSKEIVVAGKRRFTHATTWAEPLIDASNLDHFDGAYFSADHEDDGQARRIVGVLPAPADTSRVSATLILPDGRDETQELGFEYGARRPDAYWDARVAEALATLPGILDARARRKAAAQATGTGPTARRVGGA